MLALTLAADRMSLLVAVLGVVADGFVVGAVVLLVGSSVSPAMARAGRLLAGRIRPLAVAGGGGRRDGHVGQLVVLRGGGVRAVPALLVQRIAMYPLSVVLLVAALRRDRQVAWYVLPITAIGAAISAYHYLIEWYPNLDTGGCDPNNPCTLVWFRRFGFASLPFLAASGFAAIAVLVLVARHRAASRTGAGRRRTLTATSVTPARPRARRDGTRARRWRGRCRTVGEHPSHRCSALRASCSDVSSSSTTTWTDSAVLSDARLQRWRWCTTATPGSAAMAPATPWGRVPGRSLEQHAVAVSRRGVTTPTT